MHRLPLLAVLGTLAFAPNTFAAPTKAHEAWASGQIARFDEAAKSVVVKQGTHEMTFVLASDAHLVHGKTTLQPNDLSKDVGRQVKVRYTVKSGNKVADRIEVGDMAGAKTTAKK
jgi:hypothetical protein